MHRIFASISAAIFVSLSGNAYATDSAECGQNLICASKPETVVETLKSSGFRAKLGKAKDGDPKIESEASGYAFVVHFYGCENNLKCDSLQFNAGFKPEEDNTPEYANAWNVDNRFIQASANKEKELTLSYDVTTIGGLTKENFEDVANWWALMLGQFSNFVNDQANKKEKSKPS